MKNRKNSIMESIIETVKKISPTPTPTQGRSRACSFTESSSFDAQLTAEEYNKIEMDTKVLNLEVVEHALGGIAFMSGDENNHITTFVAVKTVEKDQGRFDKKKITHFLIWLIKWLKISMFFFFELNFKIFVNFFTHFNYIFKFQ